MLQTESRRTARQKLECPLTRLRERVSIQAGSPVEREAVGPGEMHPGRHGTERQELCLTSKYGP